MKKHLKEAIIIVLEGNEGTGKTTLCKFLTTFYAFHGYKTRYLREPGGDELAEKIRELVLHNEMDVVTETLLFMAARKRNIEVNLKPAMENKELIFMDRFTDCTYVYQGAVKGMTMADIDWLHNLIKADEVYIHRTNILIDVPIEEIKTRLDGRGTHDKHDDAGDEFLEKISKAYLDLYNAPVSKQPGTNAYIDRRYIVDGVGDVPDVAKRLTDIIDPILEEKVIKDEGDN